MLENNPTHGNLLLVNSSSNTTNHFPRNPSFQIHDKDMNHIMATTTTTTTATGGKFPIPKPTPAQISQQQQQAALKCPRCDSSNTKFCYYNNYSLSQPRHFCKACKRYWTRGGTLRNVPVGGGCRKNKRIRRPNNSSSTTSFSSALNDNPPPSTSIMNPLFYGLPSNNNNDLNVQFTGYDQHHPMSGFGLGFSSGLVLNDEYQNGFTSNSQLSNYGSMFGSSPSAINTITTSSTSPTTMGNASFNFKPLFPYQNLQIGSSLNGGDQGHDEINGVKLEGDRQNRFGFGPTTGSINNQIHQIGLSADNNPSYLNNSNAYWSSDLSNIGSSVTSLI